MSNHRLLIVDDDDFTRMTLSAILDSLDCDVIGDAPTKSPPLVKLGGPSGPARYEKTGISSGSARTRMIWAAQAETHPHR